MVKTLTITAADVKDGQYVLGAIDFDGHVEIDANLQTVCFASIKVTGRIYAKAVGGIKARWGIEAGEGIEAVGGIKAGWGIEAGGGITAGEGIEAGLSISSSAVLHIGYRIFAGIALWQKTVTEAQRTITCLRLASGEVAYGTLVETEKAITEPSAEAT